MRKFRGPWKGTTYRGAGELRDFIAQFQLHDVWVSKHGNELQATWSRGGSASTIDKFLSPSKLSSLLSVCEVVHFLKDAPRFSDHAPLSVKLASKAAGPCLDSWHMDQCLLAEPVSTEEIRQSLKTEGGSRYEGADWDARKQGWRTLLTKAGCNHKVCVTERNPS